MKLENSGHDIYRSFLRVASDVICISFTRLFLDPLRRKFIVKRTFQDEIKTSKYFLSSSELFVGHIVSHALL